MKISDELRKLADDLDSDDAVCTTADLYDIADLIDDEMVELPKDKDGEPIHVGDTVYGFRSGMEMTISELRMTDDGWSISTSRGYLTDAEVTHAQHDSWERIANELEEWKEDNRVNGSDEVFFRAGDLADRIRRLAKKEGDYGPF